MLTASLTAATMLGLMTPGAVGAKTTATTTPSRQASCAMAWDVVAREGVGLTHDDAAAWNRVSEAFISLSDESFDGPVSNALGDVFTASADVGAALASATGGAASHADFDAALGALGTVCAHLTVTQHKQDVARFQRFSYQAGTLSGLRASAATRANTTIASAVDRAVHAARRTSGVACLGGSTECGYFVHEIRQRPCVAGVVCIRQQSAVLPVGANDGQDSVVTLALDSLTGRRVPLSRMVPASALPPFLADLNAAVRTRLAAGGLGDDPYWDITLTRNDVHAWLPQPDGIHVWFDKFAVAPGSFGIVHVVVPWP